MLLALICFALTLYLAWVVVKGLRRGTTIGHPVLQFNRHDRRVRFWLSQLGNVLFFLFCLLVTAGLFLEYAVDRHLF